MNISSKHEELITENVDELDQFGKTYVFQPTQFDRTNLYYTANNMWTLDQYTNI